MIDNLYIYKYILNHLLGLGNFEYKIAYLYSATYLYVIGYSFEYDLALL